MTDGESRSADRRGRKLAAGQAARLGHPPQHAPRRPARAPRTCKAQLWRCQVGSDGEWEGALQQRFFVSVAADGAPIRRALGMHNALMGHIVLVDSAGRVRWQAHGFAAPGEAERLVAVTRKLLQEPVTPSDDASSPGSSTAMA